MKKFEESELVENNMGLVTLIARKMAKTECEIDDLVQEGILGLLEANKRFNPKLGWAFSTFAYRYIQGYIHKSRREFDHGCMVRLPVHWTNEQKNVFRSSSLDYVSEEGLKLSDLVADPTVSFELDEHKELYEAMSSLKEREKIVVHQIFFESATLEETGKVLGVTRERARQIKESALKKMRRFLNEQNNSC